MATNSLSTCCESGGRTLADSGPAASAQAPVYCPVYESRLLATARHELNSAAALSVYGGPYGGSQGYGNYVTYGSEASAFYSLVRASGCLPGLPPPALPPAPRCARLRRQRREAPEPRTARGWEQMPSTSHLRARPLQTPPAPAPPQPRPRRPGGRAAGFNVLLFRGRCCAPISSPVLPERAPPRPLPPRPPPLAPPRPPPPRPPPPGARPRLSLPQPAPRACPPAATSYPPNTLPTPTPSAPRAFPVPRVLAAGAPGQAGDPGKAGSSPRPGAGPALGGARRRARPGLLAAHRTASTPRTRRDPRMRASRPPPPPITPTSPRWASTPTTGEGRPLASPQPAPAHCPRGGNRGAVLARSQTARRSPRAAAVTQFTAESLRTPSARLLPVGANDRVPVGVTPSGLQPCDVLSRFRESKG